MSFKRIELNTVILISHNLMQLLEAGLPVNKALLLVSERMENRRYKRCILEIYEDVNNGVSLDEALELRNDRHFPELYIALISVGEKSGRLPEMFKRIISYYTVLNENNKKYKKARSYPLFLIGCSIMMFLFYLIFMVPIMENFISGMEVKVPKSTEKLFSFSHFIHENTVVSILYVVCYLIAFFVVYKIIKSNKIYMRVISIFAISRLYYEMIIMNCLCLVYSSGVPLLKSMDLLENNFEIETLKSYFHKIREGIEEGKSLTAALEDVNLISSTTLSLVKVGEETGYLDRNLDRLSKLLIDKFSDNLNKIVSFVQPVLFFVIGGIMCLMIIMMFGPMISATQIS